MQLNIFNYLVVNKDDPPPEYWMLCKKAFSYNYILKQRGREEAKSFIGLPTQPVRRYPSNAVVMMYVLTSTRYMRYAATPFRIS